jgi:hypothetical protein
VISLRAYFDARPIGIIKKQLVTILLHVLLFFDQSDTTIQFIIGGCNLLKKLLVTHTIYYRWVQFTKKAINDK